MQFLSTLFGDKPLAVFGAFAALVILVALVVVLMRAFSGRNFGTPGGRMRQQRLGVVDAFDLDRQRQLILIRRDNVEHLVMIGGPNDVLVEAAIIRQPAASGVLARTEPSAPALPSAVAPAIGASRPPSNEGRPEFEPPSREPVLPPAVGLGTSGAPSAPSGPRLPFPPRAASSALMPSAPRVPVQATPRENAPSSTAFLNSPPKPESAVNAQPQKAPEPPPAPAVSGPAPAPPPPAAPSAPPPVAPPPVRLNAVRAGPPPRPLRPFPTLRPGGGPLFPVRPAAPATPPAAEPPREAPAPEAAGQPPEPGSSAESADKPAKEAAESQALDSFESLEEEMAKLLGRPSTH